MSIVRCVIAVGFMFAFIGIMIALPLPVEERSDGLFVFMIGFFLVSAGIIFYMINMPKVSGEKPGAIFLRMIAIGFSVVLLSSLLSAIIDKENIISVLYTVGWVLIVMGIIIGVLSQNKRQ